MTDAHTPTLRSLDDTLPEVVLVNRADNTAVQRALRLKKKGLLRFLHTGVYSSNQRAEDEDVVRRNWSAIVAYLMPGAVLSHRSALDMAPRDNFVYVSRAAGQREIKLPGLTVRALVNPKRGPLVETSRSGAADTPYRGLHVASAPRSMLECLTQDKRLAARQIPREEIEARLDRTVQLRGPKGLNQLRDDAREVADKLEMTDEFRVLDGLIGALLGTRPATRLKAAVAIARASGKPFDADRNALFESLAGQLRVFPFADILEPARNGPQRDMFAFVESYFSNYIEGTTFTVEEAEEIVFQGRIIPQRSDDSHDVLGTFEAAQRDPLYSKIPNSSEGFLAWLKSANRHVLRSRLEKHPGEWKERPNQAGNTLFVLPDLVPATLEQAWPLLETLGHPMQKALFAMFVVSEVHPFEDGNGRTARLLMNCYLSHSEQCRIIVPTLFRDDYLLALKALTHQQDATAFIRAMRLCQAWAAQLDFDVTAKVMKRQLRDCNAIESDTRKFRLLSPKTMEPMAVPG